MPEHDAAADDGDAARLPKASARVHDAGGGERVEPHLHRRGD